jgi:zinc protease
LEIKNKEDFSLMLLNNKFPQLCDMVFFILKEGNEKYSKSDHDNFFADYGASWNFGNTGGYFSCLWEDFVPVAQRFVYILSTPEYSQNNISREIISRLNKIQQNQKEPTHIASNKLALYLFKEYSWVISDLDKCELIARYNHDTFVSFHKNFITPDNLFLVIVGNYDETSIITDLEKTFGQWKPASNATIPPDAKIPEISNPPAKHFEYYIPTDQVFIFGGRITNYCSSRDYLALFLLESYLNKKLFEIREQSGSCYAIDGNLSAYAFIKTKGFASVCAYTSQDNINAIEEKIKNVLYDTCSFGISEEELKTYKESYLMDLAKSCNTSSEEISTYNFIIANNKTWDYYLDRYKTVESLTLDEVNNVAKKYLNPEEWTFIHVGRIKSG